MRRCGHGFSGHSNRCFGWHFGCWCGRCLLRTLKVRAWCRAVFAVGFGSSGCCVHIGLGFFAGVVLARFACTFAAVTAVTVTRAALTAFAVVVRRRTAFWGGLGFLSFGDHQLCFRGVVFAGGVVSLAAFATTLTTFATAFATAFAAFTATLATAFTAAFTTGCAFVAHFSAIGVQLGCGIAAAFVSAFIAVLATTIATAFTRGALACRTLCAFTTLSTLAACGAGFAFTQFVAAFCAVFSSAFTTTTTFAGCADFTGSTFAALTTAAITTTTAAIATAFTAFTITAFMAALAIATFAAFACFFVFLANRC